MRLRWRNLFKRLDEDSEPARRIKHLAIKSAVGAWFMSMVCCLIGGMGMVQAPLEATVAAAGGFLAWVIYREISGRYDALVIIMWACTPSVRHVTVGATSGIFPTVVMVGILILMSPVMALSFPRPAQADQDEIQK